MSAYNASNPLPPSTRQLVNLYGAPIVGGVVPLKYPLLQRKDSTNTTIPLENQACGIHPGEPEVYRPPPTYWLRVNNQKRQSKWNRLYFDDDE